MSPSPPTTARTSVKAVRSVPPQYLSVRWGQLAKRADGGTFRKPRPAQQRTERTSRPWGFVIPRGLERWRSIPRGLPVIEPARSAAVNEPFRRGRPRLRRALGFAHGFADRARQPVATVPPTRRARPPAGAR